MLSFEYSLKNTNPIEHNRANDILYWMWNNSRWKERHNRMNVKLSSILKDIWIHVEFVTADDDEETDTALFS